MPLLWFEFLTWNSKFEWTLAIEYCCCSILIFSTKNLSHTKRSIAQCRIFRKSIICTGHLMKTMIETLNIALIFTCQNFFTTFWIYKLKDYVYTKRRHLFSLVLFCFCFFKFKTKILHCANFYLVVHIDLTIIMNHWTTIDNIKPGEIQYTIFGKIS